MLFTGGKKGAYPDEGTPSQAGAGKDQRGIWGCSSLPQSSVRDPGKVKTSREGRPADHVLVCFLQEDPVLPKSIEIGRGLSEKRVA